MATAALSHMTPEEYLAVERHAEFKSEYIDGRVIAMTPGGSLPHNFIAGNLYAGLLARFAGGPCHVFFADVRVRFGRDGRDYTYPDLMALCGEPTFDDDEQDTVTNPALIVEVLSRSTQAYDRGRKFEGYKAIDSLREYVLISQDEVRVERHTRSGNFWVCTVETNLDGLVELASVGCSIPMREIYNRTRFSSTG
jgi:Uma2 family endonuclease